MSRQWMVGVAGLAAATLLLESTLIRLLSVAQYYHFAFLVVSLALLGFGASGSLLSVFSQINNRPEQLLVWLGWGFAISVGLAYGIINIIPFDSYSIAWDRRQIPYFLIYFLFLTLPFLCSGLGIGASLAASKERSHRVYAANLFGSAFGALIAPLVLGWVGVPGAVLVSALLGVSPVLVAANRWTKGLIPLLVLLVVGYLGGRNRTGDALMGLTISPYKGLSYALQFPGSRQLFAAWSAVSRVDVVGEAGIRQLPGLSYTYSGLPPTQYGLSVDASAPQPITLIDPDAFDAGAYLPEAVAFNLRSEAKALVIEPAGGLAVVQALAGGANQVTALVEDATITRAVAETAGSFDVYHNSRVQLVHDSSRVFLEQGRSAYDLIMLPLTDGYRPVTSGAYSLAENYLLTEEAFKAMMSALAPDGIFVATRWLQSPPSESLRLIGLVLAGWGADYGVTPADGLVAYRGIQTLTVLVQPDGWSANELNAIRNFTTERRYDLVWAPDLNIEEVNLFNRLPSPMVYEAVRDLITAGSPEDFYVNYLFAVDPPEDDHPFFFHFFTWEQTPELLATFGKVWQPFGGSGYFVLLGMLALVLILSGILIISPLLVSKRKLAVPPEGFSTRTAFGYFSLLGIAFLFIEIPLIQRWILVLGNPTYAFTGVVLSLLLFSGIGSWGAKHQWIKPKWALGLLAVLAFTTPVLVSGLLELSLGWPFVLRAGATVIVFAPLGVLMGLPFPLGLAWLEARAPAYVPWAWAVNGCVSVIAAVLAAILALSTSFSTVIWLGAVAYGMAFFLYSRF